MLNYSLAPIIYTKERFDATAYFSTVMQALLYEKNQIPMDLYYEDILINCIEMYAYKINRLGV